MAKISIVMAVYNGAEDVSRCIDSLINQTHQDIEIICVDDGSTDNTLEILNKYSGDDARVKVFSQGENTKLLKAIKRGVKEATGDYIMFVDDDDWYEINACERVAGIIESDNPDVIYYGTNMVEPDGSVNESIRESRAKLLGSCNMKFKAKNTLNVDGIGYVYLWNKAVKADVCKKAYAAIPAVEMTYLSDMYGCQMIHYYARSIVCITDKLINYNYANGISAESSMTAEKYGYMCKCIKLFETGVKEFYEKEGDQKELESFQAGLKKRIFPYICTWRDKVPDEESTEALQSLIDAYGAEQVIPMLKHNYYQVNVDRRKYLKQLENN